MIRAQRLDLGADVVVVPSEELVVIHPDLTFGEALGAVSAVLPELHMDAVVGIVEQVTPTPQPEPRFGHWRISVAVVLLVTSIVLLVSGFADSDRVHPHKAVVAEET